MTPGAMLEQLVAFDTVSAKSNLALIDFVQDYLKSNGVTARTQKSEAGDKADLIATLGPDVGGGVILSGHTDVVPVDGQNWSTDPFLLTEREGRLYGRGAADMKGFIAVVLALVPEILKAGLNRPLHIVLSYDEEVGCLGAPGLIKRYRKDFPEALAAIIGEPTEMKLANAHKGIAAFETRITGKPGHSSNPGAGVNAINYAARCIKALEDIADDFRRGGKHPRFSPPHATLSVGTIEGGNAINIIAENCVIGWECRSVTGTEADEAIAKFEEYCRSRLVPEMQEGDAGAGIETRRTAHVPPLRSDGDNVAEELVRRLTGQNEAGVISFAAEAGLFQEAGIPAVIIGPGSIAQAHRADEYVSIDQLEECTLFIRRITGWAAA